MCERGERRGKALQSLLTRQKTQRFLLPHDSSSLPLCPALLVLLTNLSLDLVEPSFLMKTLTAEQKLQYLGRGGIWWGGDSALSAAAHWLDFKKRREFITSVVSGV